MVKCLTDTANRLADGKQPNMDKIFGWRREGYVTFPFRTSAFIPGGSITDSEAESPSTPMHLRKNAPEDIHTLLVAAAENTSTLHESLVHLQNATQKFCLNRMSVEVKDSCRMQ